MVVHVVHRTNAEDISVAQIQSQIDILNEDFRAQNADTSTVPSVFSGLIGDARIQFALASADPDGNPTDGITRTRTYKINCATVSFHNTSSTRRVSFAISTTSCDIAGSNPRGVSHTITFPSTTPTYGGLSFGDGCSDRPVGTS